MNKYGLHNKLVAQAGKGDELTAILLDAAAILSNVQGCQIYLVSQDAANGDIIWISEVWDSKEDHGQSLQLDAVRTLIGKAMPIIAEPPKTNTMMVVKGGVGLK